MKLIIDISEEDYKNVSRIVDMGLGTNVDEAIKNGTPLDDLRADLHATAEMHSDGDYYLRDEWIDEYFDNIGKESEE